MCGDPFRKPNGNLGRLSRPPFYVVELKRMGGSAIPAAGLLADHHCRALGWDGQPIDGLYVAGNIPWRGWRPGPSCKAESPTHAV